MLQKVMDQVLKESMQLKVSEGEIFLPIVFHFHQPVDNFEWVFEHAFEQSYKPLLQCIKRHPSVKVGIHLSGPVLEWLENKQPEYLDQLANLTKHNQLELIGGAFYEAILPIIPDEDKLAQIQMMRDYAHDLFGTDIHGFWLAERVWEPHLPKIFEEAHIEYVMIDDYHVRICGFDEEEVLHAFTTEEQGAQVTVMPINEKIRYLIPWKPATQTFEYLSSLRNVYDDSRLVFIISDAEKMGIWPAEDGRSTHDVCYVTGYDGLPWLDKWFTFIEILDWVVSISPHEYLRHHRPKKLIYLPNASYDRMEVWALPTESRRRLETLLEDASMNRVYSTFLDGSKIARNKEVLQFSKGTFWRNFLVKYPESNTIHKRVMFGRKIVKQAEKLVGKTQTINKAWKEIYKAECNDIYWHGLFAGVYYIFLRHAAFKHTITAQKIAEQILKEQGTLKPVQLIKEDVEKDGNDEIVLQNDDLAVFIKPHDGGSIYEIDQKQSAYNILTVLTRRMEAYHDESTKMVQDRWRRTAFRDHFIPSDTSLHQIIDDTFQEWGDFTTATYEVVLCEVQNEIARTILTKQGSVKACVLNLTKEIVIKADSREISVTYDIIANLENEKPLQATFVPEINFIMTGDPTKVDASIDTSSIDLFKNQVLSGKHFSSSDPENGVTVKIQLKQETQLFLINVESKAKSELGWESLYQGTGLYPLFELNLSPGMKTQIQLKLLIDP
ncbi:MAG: alpha-amylase/4-alpha-glucanotransferase domain-containing protein [Candidatus Heimdallarchaeota archaeon]